MQNNTTIYLIRHGLDDEKFIGGWSTGRLIKEGIKQVNKVPTIFVIMLVISIPFIIVGLIELLNQQRL